MEIRVGYFAANSGSVAPPLRWPPATLMQNTGQNLGNLVFWHAVRRMFDNAIVPVAWDAQAADIGGSFDHLVIPAANYLNPAWDFAAQAELIDRLGHEILCFGLGAQSDDERPLVLRPGTVRFLKALSAHCRTIFVRGDYTAEICAAHGVKNVLPLGCPSITLSADPTLGQTLQRRAADPLGALYVAGGMRKGNTRAAERVLFREVLARDGSSFVIQHPIELLELAAGARMQPPKMFAALVWHEFLDPGASFRQFHRSLGRVARWYGDVPQWLAEAGRHSHSIGTRMHGAVMSLMAGVPTIILAHDARVREMCRAMAIPHLDPAELGDRLADLGGLFAEMAVDAAGFDANRRRIARVYRDYLAGAGLAVSASLESLAGATVDA